MARGPSRRGMETSAPGPMTYSRTNPSLVIVDHTEVVDRFKGQGVGKQLVAEGGRVGPGDTGSRSCRSARSPAGCSSGRPSMPTSGTADALAMPRPLDAFMPAFDVCERHTVRVRAPATLVYRVAREIDVQSLPLVRAIFWARERLMGSRPARRLTRGFINETRALGWACLLERPGELYVSGAACQPWLADVVFEPIAPERFRGYGEPGRVKIAWTIECHPRGTALTELASETRALATDDEARRRFLAYWQWARVGIVSIRWLLLPAIRRRAEALYRAAHAGGRE